MDILDDVLVVDDDADMLEVIVALLNDRGFRARTADNGAAALAAVADRRPGVVLLDISMPVMDGRRCAHELRGRYGAGLPIVVMTAAEHAGARARDLGADAVLPKPFGATQLLAAVKRFVPKRA